MARPRKHDHDAIAAAVEAGRATTEIAAEFNCHPNIVRQIAYRHGLRVAGSPDPERDAEIAADRAAGMTLLAICAKHDLGSTNTVAAALRRHQARTKGDQP